MFFFHEINTFTFRNGTLIKSDSNRDIYKITILYLFFWNSYSLKRPKKIHKNMK